MSVQELESSIEQTNPEEVMNSLGESEGSSENINDSSTPEGTSNNTNSKVDPLFVQKRLKQQTRQHEREMRDMQAQLYSLQNQLGNNAGGNAPVNSNNGPDDNIQRAVNFALQQRDLAERKQKDAESQSHIQQRYGDFQKHLDSMDDKYEDFHDTVLNRDIPITSTMRDYAVTLPTKGKGSAGEVLYHLAKNPDELKRISKLHSLDQAAEMAKLSHALISGGENKIANTQSVPLSSIKSTPVSTSGSITDKTPVSVIRAQMKAGKW